MRVDVKDTVAWESKKRSEMEKKKNFDSSVRARNSSSGESHYSQLISKVILLLF